MRKIVRSTMLGVLGLALILVSGAPAAVISDFTLSDGHGFDANPQVIFSLIQIEPEPFNPNPPLSGVNVSFLVSYGTIGSFTGMFFEFINQSTSPNNDSTLTSIVFETTGLLSDPNYLEWSGTQVSYTIGGNVPVSGGFDITFNADLNADPTNPGGYSKNGVTQNEHLLIGFTIDDDNGHSYQSLLEDLLIGGPENYSGWTVGAHLQGTVGTSTSIWLASYTEEQSSPFDDETPVVPVPAAAGLGFLGMALVGVMRRKRR